jgi:uncharacterized lipoprotein NlpE involved in copper resistance
MDQTKSPLQSRTIIGVLIALIPTILKIFGIDLGADSASTVAQAVELGFEFGGSVLAIYGRWQATKRIA